MIPKIFIVIITYILIIGFYAGIYNFFKTEFSLTIKDINNIPTNVPITIFDCLFFSCSIFSANGLASSDSTYMKPKSRMSKIIIASQQVISLLAIVFGAAFVIGDCNKKLSIDNETFTKYSHMKKIISQDANKLNSELGNVLNSDTSISNNSETNIGQTFKIVPVN